MSFFAELKRRHVIRAGVAYLALAWLLIEVAGTLFPGFGIPDWAFRFVVIVLALGFVPVLVFSWAYEITPEGVKRENEVVRDEAAAFVAAKRLDKLTIGIVAVALAFVVVDRIWLGSRFAEPAAVSPVAGEESAQSVEQETELPPNSIAVLPFANRSAKSEDVFFVDGIHDDLLTFISQIGSIKTISRTSVMKYRDSTQSIPEIARELAVATVLEGGVQRAGNQVRINVQLIDARTDDHLWSQIYDRQLTASNIFAIQSEIAGSIAEALRAELTPEASERITSVPTENLEALEAYFIAKQSMVTRRVSDLAKAVENFENAVELDPDFALAWVGLADTYLLQASYAGLPRDEMLAKSRDAAELALQLDPRLGEAYAAVAKRMDWEGEEESAELAFQRALELNPNYAPAYQWYGEMLGGMRARITEALKLSRKAVELDPKSAIIINDYAEVLEGAGRFEDALAHYEQAVEIEPGFAHGYRRIADLQAGHFGRVDRAIIAYHRNIAIDPDSWAGPSGLGALYLELGDDRQAEYWFRLALEQAPRGVAQMGADLGRLYLYRGEYEQAMEYFESVMAGSWEHQVALYHQVNHGLEAGDMSAAITHYEQAFPGLLDDESAVNAQNHVAALHLAGIYSWAGETERMERLLDLASQEVDSYGVRHYEDEAVIHALRGDDKAALDSLSSMGLGVQTQVWREFVVGHPAFRDLLEDPEFQILNEEFEAEMARQLARVREMEANGELPSMPGS